MKQNIKDLLEFFTEAKKIMNESDSIAVVENHNYSVSVKVNYTLKEEIRKRAKEAGMTISAFVRFTLTELLIDEKGE